MVEAIADELPAPLALPLRGAARAGADRPAARRRSASAAALFDPLLHNTASVTIVGGGEKINVIPDEVTVEIDCRLLPGLQSRGRLRRAARARRAWRSSFEVIRYDPVAAEPDMALFDMLAGVLRELDPAAQPIPLLLPGVTDGRFFSRLGIQTYGFLPMQLPDELPFMQLIHAAGRAPAGRRRGVRHARDRARARTLPLRPCGRRAGGGYCRRRGRAEVEAHGAELFADAPQARRRLLVACRPARRHQVGVPALLAEAVRPDVAPTGNARLRRGVQRRQRAHVRALGHEQVREAHHYPVGRRRRAVCRFVAA